MENKLLKKLFIKSGYKVFLAHVPENAVAILGDIPVDVEIQYSHSTNFDVLLLFVKNSTELIEYLKAYTPLLKPDTIFWIAYPKKSSGITSDLTMSKWDELNPYALTPCSAAAIDNTWTALRIKPLGTSKPSGICNDDIEKNEYGAYIDVKNKQVTLPEDLKAALEHKPNALAFYQKLSYSNRKEYVLWVLTAKQEKTRLDRIQKTIEKLGQEKKNPAEK